MLYRLARIVRGQGELCDIDEIGLDARTLSQLVSDKPGCVLAHSAHSGRTKDHRDVQTPIRIHNHARHSTASSSVNQQLKREVHRSPQYLSRPFDRSTLELDDLAPLFQGLPLV